LVDQFQLGFAVTSSAKIMAALPRMRRCSILDHHQTAHGDQAGWQAALQVMPMTAVVIPLSLV
jgi:hypothetical protein